jgi:hypothetical protein
LRTYTSQLKQLELPRCGFGRHSFDERLEPADEDLELANEQRAA